jgi:hypothetical protein
MLQFLLIKVKIDLESHVDFVNLSKKIDIFNEKLQNVVLNEQNQKIELDERNYIKKNVNLCLKSSANDRKFEHIK